MTGKWHNDDLLDTTDDLLSSLQGDDDPIDSPTIEQARAIAAAVKHDGSVLSLARIGANPMLRSTPYRNKRGVLIDMWSCISYYFEAMPDATILNSPHIVRPWKLEDWEINLISTPWVVNQISKTAWGRMDIMPVEDSPFGGTICEWETTPDS